MTTQLSDHAKTILRAIADEKDIVNVHGVMLNAESALFFIADGGADILSIAPETRSINGVTFAAPVREGWSFSEPQVEKLQDYEWLSGSDRDAAYNAIIDALEGRTKS